MFNPSTLTQAPLSPSLFLSRSKIKSHGESRSQEEQRKERKKLIVEKLYFNLRSSFQFIPGSTLKNTRASEHDGRQDTHREKDEKCFQSVVIFLIVSKLNFNGFPFRLPPRSLAPFHPCLVLYFILFFFIVFTFFFYFLSFFSVILAKYFRFMNHEGREMWQSERRQTFFCCCSSLKDEKQKKRRKEKRDRPRGGSCRRNFLLFTFLCVFWIYQPRWNH